MPINNFLGDALIPSQKLKDKSKAQQQELQYLFELVKDQLVAERLYLCVTQRDSLRLKTKARLSNHIPGPEKYMLSSTMISSLLGKHVYFDGNELVDDHKTILLNPENYTYEQLIGKLTVK